MLDHLNAIKARLETSGNPVYLIDVPEGEAPAFPYFIVWSSAGDPRRQTLAGGRDELRNEVGITSAGLSPESALIVSQIARDLLIDWTPTVAGWLPKELKFFDSRPVQADRDQTLPNSNRHPYFGVDIYRLTSERDDSYSPSSSSSSSSPSSSSSSSSS